HFDIPLAGALSLDAKAQALLRQGNAPAALALAQQALAQAPDSAAVNQALGQVLDANGQSEAANQYYQKALTIAKAEQPAFQAARIDALETRINSKKPDTGGGGRGIRGLRRSWRNGAGGLTWFAHRLSPGFHLRGDPGIGGFHSGA